MSLRILIVEDEHLGMERLARQLKSLGKELEVAGMTDSVASSVKWLQSNPAPDLILMDIDLGDGQSFEIFHQVPVTSHIVFTTSYDEQSLLAFQSNQIDYLLKPIRKTELEAAINKYIFQELAVANEKVYVDELVESLKKQVSKNVRQRFIARDGNRLISIETSEIAYFYSEESSTFVRTKNKKRFLLEHTIDEIEYSVDALDYFRINSEWIVGFASVARTHLLPNGSLNIYLKPQRELPVGVDKEQQAAFENWIKRKI